MGKPWLWWGTVLILALTVGEGSAQDKGDGKTAPRVGLAAPDFTLKTTGKKTINLSDLRGKKAILLNFWATWCQPCRLEMPTMEKLYREYKPKGLEILAVSVDSGPESAAAAAVKKFMAELGLTFPGLLDYRQEVTGRYKLMGLPTTFLIDRQGIIRAMEVGYRDWTTLESRKKIEGLLGSP